MSHALNRIRSLVSEIDQIQRQGQKSPRGSSVLEVPVDAPRAAPEPVIESAPEPVPGKTSSPVTPLRESRVGVHWSGSVVLEVMLPQNGEKLELRQLGEWIEIRFQDGKAFHIPFKAVA